MKKTHLIIESILAVAIIFLFFLYFNLNKTGKNSDSSNKLNLNTSGSIAYVNVDSVLQNYLMYNELKMELEGKKNKIESELDLKGRKLQSAVQDYQNKVSKGLVTRVTAAEMEQELQMEQQKLMQLQQNYQAQLVEEEQVMHRKLINSMMEYLNEFNKNKGFTYILGNSFGGNILYADAKYNVTNEVIKGLNLTYKKK